MLPRRLVLLILVGALGATFVRAEGKPEPRAPAGPTLAATITSSPLVITVNDNTAIAYDLEGRNMYFGPSDSGTFLAIDGKVYGPTPAANQDFNPLAYTPVSNVVTGTGSAADPFVITTRVTAGATGIGLVQTLSYVAGDQDYSITFRVENNNPQPKAVRVIHAADMYVNFPDNDLDYGYAFGDSQTGAIGSVTRTGQYVQALVPSTSTPPSAYQVSDWRENPTPFWNYLGNTSGDAGPGLQNIIQPGYIDIVAGFQWDLTIPALTPDRAGAAPAAVGSTTVTVTGAFGRAGDFGIRPFNAYLPDVLNP